MRTNCAATVVAAAALAGVLCGCGGSGDPSSQAAPSQLSMQLPMLASQPTTPGRAPARPATVLRGGAGDRLLYKARRAALRADYLEVAQWRREEQLLSRDVNVLKRRGQVLIWEDGRRSFTWRSGMRCFDRHTEYRRGAVTDVRRSASPPDLTGSRLSIRHGTRVVRGRARHTDFADTLFEVRIASSGRPQAMRQRQARFGVIPPGRWFHNRYEFLDAAEFARRAGGPPGPLCQKHDR